MGNPWEIVRNDISYPVKFYGKVVTGSDGKRRWIGGEDIVAVASDVPILGYITKTTINRIGYGPLKFHQLKLESNPKPLFFCFLTLTMFVLCIFVYICSTFTSRRIVRLYN